MGDTQLSYDNVDGMENVSQIRRQFKDAFGKDAFEKDAFESEAPSESNERIKQLED